MAYEHEYHEPQEKTKEEFIDFLKEMIPLRKEYKRDCDKPSDLSEEELEVIYSLYATKTMGEACEALKPLYEKYKGGKGKNKMPEMVVRGIYFIIMRECTLLMMDNKSIMEKDGKLRRKIKLNCTNQAYKLLGEQSSKKQERMGIRPFWDFAMLNYEPVGFCSIKRRGKTFREVLLSILYQAEYPAFVDLSGDMTILEDIYYCEREIIYCSDSNAANFYYAVKLRYNELCKAIQTWVSDLDAGMAETEESYRRELENIRMNSKEVYYERCSQELKDEIKNLEQERPTIITCPADYDSINLYNAYMYFVVTLWDTYKMTLADFRERIQEMLSNELQWLSIRLKNAYICWGGIKDILNAIDKHNMQLLSLDRNKKYKFSVMNAGGKGGWVYYENIEARMERERKEIIVESMLDLADEEETEKQIKKYRANKEKRLKKGVLFYDSSVMGDMADIMEFIKFVNQNDCSWIFVYNKNDREWKELLKGGGRRIIEINTESLYYFCFRHIWKEGLAVITNIELKGLLNEQIVSSSDMARTIFRNQSKKWEDADIFLIKDTMEQKSRYEFG